MYFVGKNFDILSWLKRLATRPTLGCSMTLLCLPVIYDQRFPHSFDINPVNKSVGTGRANGLVYRLKPILLFRFIFIIEKNKKKTNKKQKTNKQTKKNQE